MIKNMNYFYYIKRIYAFVIFFMLCRNLFSKTVCLISVFCLIAIFRTFQIVCLYAAANWTIIFVSVFEVVFETTLRNITQYRSWVVCVFSCICLNKFSFIDWIIGQVKKMCVSVSISLLQNWHFCFFVCSCWGDVV